MPKFLHEFHHSIYASHQHRVIENLHPDLQSLYFPESLERFLLIHHEAMQGKQNRSLSNQWTLFLQICDLSMTGDGDG